MKKYTELKVINSILLVPPRLPPFTASLKPASGPTGLSVSLKPFQGALKQGYYGGGVMIIEK